MWLCKRIHNLCGCEPRGRGQYEAFIVNKILSRFALVCRKWRHIAQRRLFETVLFDTADCLQVLDFPESLDERQRLALFLKTIKANGNLSVYVKHLVLRCKAIEASPAVMEKFDLLDRVHIADELRLEWNLYPYRGIVRNIHEIIGICLNMRLLITDDDSVFAILLMNLNFKTLRRFKTVVIPRVSDERLEVKYNLDCVSPWDVLCELPRWPNVEEFHVSSLVVRSVSVPWSGSVDLNVFSELGMGDRQEYCLDQDFFPEFMKVYKKKVYEFGGVIEGDELTAKTLADCLPVWSP